MAKPFRYLLKILLLVAVFGSPAFGQKKIAASEAKDHYGEMATVCGEVVSARFSATSNGEPTFLNFDKAYPNQIFTVVIWGDNRSKFGKPEDEFQGKRICVTGKITAYAGLPEIVLVDPKQVSFDDKR
jgi:DNA/RNA endonuclease YhcR with UshA esterase domain